MRHRQQSAFTFIELLVVMALLSVLATLTAVGIHRSIESAKVTQCLNHLRAIGMAAALYSADQGGRLPQSSHQGLALAWRHVLPDYMNDSEEVFRSPLAPNSTQSFSYAINDFLTVHPYGAPELDYSKRQNIDAPAQTLFFTLMTKKHGPTDHFHFADSVDSGYTPSAFLWQVQTDVSGKCGHYLFVDGHAAALPWKTIKNELTRPGSKFINPAGHKN